MFDDELNDVETFDDVTLEDDVLLDVVADDVDDVAPEDDVLLDVVADDDVLVVDDESDDVEVLEDVVLLLVLLDEETCGAEGVAVGVGSSA